MATARIGRFLAETRPVTPLIVIDLDIVRAVFAAARGIAAGADLLRGQGQPGAQIVAALAELGANFDLASPGETFLCESLRTAADRLSYGNRVKRESAIGRAAAHGIDLFAFDSMGERAPAKRPVQACCACS